MVTKPDILDHFAFIDSADTSLVKLATPSNIENNKHEKSPSIDFSLKEVSYDSKENSAQIECQEEKVRKKEVE